VGNGIQAIHRGLHLGHMGQVEDGFPGIRRRAIDKISREFDNKSRLGIRA